MNSLPPSRLSFGQAFLRYYLPPVLWAGLVAYFSTSMFTWGFTFHLLLKVLRWFDPTVTIPTVVQLTVLLRKLAHATEYAILAGLLFRALRRGAPEAWRAKWAVWTMAVCVLYAVSDELHQYFVPHRTSSPLDVLIDASGAGLMLVLLYWRARRAGRALVAWSPEG